MTIVVRPMIESDRAAARQICHTAFGTFLGAPDPQNFWADRDYVYGRFGAEHVAGFTAELDNEVVGCNFATRWGSVGFFGPIAIRPDLWDRGVAQPLVAAVSDAFEEWGVSHAGLCHLSAQPEAYSPLRKVWVSPPLPDPADGGASTSERRRRLVALLGIDAG